jgi:hypothetical protein
MQVLHVLPLYTLHHHLHHHLHYQTLYNLRKHPRQHLHVYEHHLYTHLDHPLCENLHHLYTHLDHNVHENLHHLHESLGHHLDQETVVSAAADETLRATTASQQRQHSSCSDSQQKLPSHCTSFYNKCLIDTKPHSTRLIPLLEFI